MTLEFELTEGTSLPPVDDHQFDALLELLRQDKVTRLSISGQDATSERLDAIASALGRNQALETFELRQSRNSNEPQARLYQALAQAPNLRTFRAEYCFAELEATQAMFDLMATHQRLTHVHVQYNGFGVPKTQLVAPVLAHNGGIRELDISFNAMGDAGVDLLADALESNKGLVKINVDTSYDIEPSIPAVERMLKTNRNLMECHGLTSETIAARLEENRADALALADAMAQDISALDSAQWQALPERIAAVAYLLETEHGLSPEEVSEHFKEALLTGRKQGVDIFPSMMSVFPMPDMFALAAEMGEPLSMKDFHVPGSGKTPLLDAVIERGAGASLFRLDMQWQDSGQIEAVYHLLPEVQQRQVANKHQLKMQVDAKNRRDVGRRMVEL